MSLFVAGAVVGEVQVSVFVAGAVLGEVQVSVFVAGAVLGEAQVSLFAAGAVLGEAQVSLFVAGAVLGEAQVSLFMAGTVLGEVQVSVFVAGVVLGEAQVSLFLAGAVLGEIWEDSRSANCCIFQYKMVALSAKSNLCCAAGCGLTGSCSVHSRIMIGRASEMTFQLFSANFCQMLGGHFAWQAQYLVSLEGDICCSAHCK